jgi:GntR family transcriptional regulator/MocR family aminotransferase
VTRNARPVQLPIELALSGAPLRHRIADALIDLLRSGRLRPGDTLPATRALAAELAISRTAVLAAYDELAAAGFVHATAGSATVVAPGADVAARAGVSSHVAARAGMSAHVAARAGMSAHVAARAGMSSQVAPHPAGTAEARPPAPAEPRWNLLPGYPDTSLIAAGHWRAAWRAAARLPAPFASPWGQPLGSLQRALAVHLRRTRGVAAEPADIICVPGVCAGLRALTAAAGLAGRPVAFEQPGYAEGRRALQAAGAVIRPVPVGEAGLDPADLAAGDAAVYTTPAHQFPLGARLPAARRAALIGWARRVGGLVIEDDYDGEFRYDVRGLPALQSMTGGPDVVAYLGTASKILSPGLRVAWLIAPADLRPSVRDALAATDETIAVPSADAVAQFITSGHLAGHLARAARTYAARRRALIAGLHDTVPELRVSGVDAGLHLVADLPPGSDEAAVQRRLLAAGLAVDVLGQFSTEPLDRQALVCGYALLPETQAAGAAAAVARALAAQ